VTSEVIKWNWQRFLDPATRWSCRPMFDGGNDAGGVKVAAIETPAPDTVVFRLERASPLFLTLMASVQCLPAAFARSSVDAQGAWVKPVGTGPFVFGEWRRGRDVTLERFSRYQARPDKADGLAGNRTPRVDRLRMMVVPDVTASIQAFNAGEIDVLPNLAPGVIADVRNRAGVAMKPQQMLGWTVLLLQTQDPLLKDVRVRQAIAHALDRAQIARIATGGRGRANASAVATGSMWHTAAHDRFPAYDRERAKSLLRAAGYRGQPIVIQTNRHYPNMYDNAVMAQAMLQSVGLNARIEVLDWATQLSNYQAGKFQVSSFSYSARFDPALAYGLLLGRKQERPTVQWESEAAEQLLATASNSTDPATRRRAFEDLHAIMAREVPIIGLYNGVAITATGPGISGYRTWPGATPILWGISKR
jgi:peptide/nickel transport system substrate-binding protein